jgi:hypothetical protein
MERGFALLICAGLLAGCSAVPQSQGQQGASAPQIRQPVIASAPEARQCLAQLDQAGARFTALPDQYTGQGCSTLGTVQMTALRSDASLLSISNIGPVQCEVSNAFAAWARYGVDRAAQQLLGSPIARIETFGSYSCRNVAGTVRRSAHATAGAIDISGFVLADGRRISVAEDWSGGTPEEREFLRVVQRSACRRFDTVLGPDYNEAHRDHLHLEGVIDGNSFCR